MTLSQPAIVLFLFYNGTEAEGRKHFREFYALEPIVADMAKEIPFEELNAMQVRQRKRLVG